MIFKVNRGTWRRGGKDKNDSQGSTLLLNDQGYRCCLGFVSQQLGVSDEQMFERSTPNQCSDVCLHGVLLDEIGEQTPLTIRAMRINDDGSISDEDRESRLIALFAEHGHELIFED